MAKRPLALDSPKFGWQSQPVLVSDLIGMHGLSTTVACSLGPKATGHFGLIPRKYSSWNQLYKRLQWVVNYFLHFQPAKSQDHEWIGIYPFATANKPSAVVLDRYQSLSISGHWSSLRKMPVTSHLCPNPVSFTLWKEMITLSRHQTYLGTPSGSGSLRLLEARKNSWYCFFMDAFTTYNRILPIFQGAHELIC